MGQSKRVNHLYKVIRQNMENYLKIVKNEPVSVIVSGGIDSSIIAKIAQEVFSKIEFFTMVAPHSADLPFIKILAKNLLKPIHEINLPDPKDILNKDLIEIKNILVKNNLDTHLTAITLALGFKLLFLNISQQKIKHVLTGQGPDILLAGYYRYKNTPSHQLITNIKNDLPMLDIDIKRDNAIANIYQIKLHNAYLENNFIQACQELNSDDLINNGQNKFILRKLGAKLGLPKQIVHRPKKAFQYSTGLQKVLIKRFKSL